MSNKILKLNRAHIADVFRVSAVEEVCWWRTLALRGRPCPADGEARAMLHAMEGATDHGWPAVIFEGDKSLEIINILSDGSKSFAYYEAILESCSVLVHHFKFVKFQFVKRTRAIL